jgi:hypothetical protein
MRLLEFDGDPEIPYPLRGPLNLVDPVPGLEGDDAEAAHKAYVLAAFGAFGRAAERYGKLVEAHESATLLDNQALCLAWCGEEQEAARLLHRAGEVESDFERAVESETVAQLLEFPHGENVLRTRTQRYTTPSIARVLSEADGQNLFRQVPLGPEAGHEGVPDAMLEVLSSPLGPASAGEEVDPDQIPRILGNVHLYDDEAGPTVVVSAFGEEPFEQVRTAIGESGLPLEALGDPVDATGGFPEEFQFFRWRWAFPEGFPLRRQREIERDRWRNRIAQFRETPLSALGGKTAQEAVGDEALRVRLAATVSVLDTIVDHGRQELDRNELRSDLGLPQEEAIEADGRSLQTLSTMKLMRLELDALDPKGLELVLNRAFILRHRSFLSRVLEETLKRPPAELDLGRVYATLSDFSRERGDIEAALNWIGRGKEYAKNSENAFEEVFRWETRELALRLEDPQDEGFEPFVRKLQSYYGPKLPQFEEYLQSILSAYGVTLGPQLATTSPASQGGLWTPENDPQPTSGQKLWLPGQS